MRVMECKGSFKIRIGAKTQTGTKKKNIPAYGTRLRLSNIIKIRLKVHV